jgi:hypothetical protein
MKEIYFICYEDIFSGETIIQRGKSFKTYEAAKEQIERALSLQKEMAEDSDDLFLKTGFSIKKMFIRD